MKGPSILAPINSPGEAGPLIGAGAGWLYGGCLPKGWAGRYPSTVLINQRTFPSAQLESPEALAEAVSSCHHHGGRFALALNAPFYMDSQLPAVFELAGLAAEAGADALIVADPGLIRRLSGRGNRLPLHLSTMGLAANRASVRMFRGMGVERVILPRSLTVADIARLIREEPSMNYEAFVLVGKCPNVEGVCSFVHDSADGRWPCEWAYSMTGEDMDAPPVGVAAAIDGVRRSDRRDSCGLCALPALVAAGVSSFKVVGRGAPLARRLGLVRALAESLAATPIKGDPRWPGRCRQVYRGLFGHPCSAHNCYYPEVTRGSEP